MNEKMRLGERGGVKEGMRAPGLAWGKASVSVQSSKRDGEEEAEWQEDHQAGETRAPEEQS